MLIITVLIISTVIITVVSLETTSSLFLTPFIKQNNTEEARRLSLVDPENFLNVISYSGFLTVDERYNSNLFFWYFPALNKELSNTTWIIWLQGGPGATSLVGLFGEMGPFEYTNNELKLRNTSWCKEFSMVFIDNPVGSGFSFTDSSEGYSENMEMYSENLYKGVKQLATLYPELGQSPLYIAGESYAGRYVPGLAMKIAQGMTSDNSIDLKGLILGNPLFDHDSIVDYTRIFYNWGLIDSQGALAAKSLQEKYAKEVRDGNAVAAYKLRNQLLDRLQGIAMKDQAYHVLKDDVIPNIQDFVSFVTEPSIRKVIHVGNMLFHFDSLKVHQYMEKDFLADVSSKIDELLEHYRILVYCGQLDLITSCVQNVEARRKKWRWSRRNEFLNAPRTPWWFNNTVAGYVKSGGGFTEVLVKDAGHLVPIDKPEQAKLLVSNFIRNTGQLPLPPNYKISINDTPTYEEYKDSETSKNATGLIVSVVFNIILLILIIAGVVMFVRWKRQNEFFYSPLNEDIMPIMSENPFTFLAILLLFFDDDRYGVLVSSLPLATMIMMTFIIF